jgi:hypothetical protein
MMAYPEEGLWGFEPQTHTQESKLNLNEKVIKDCGMLNRERETAEKRPFKPSRKTVRAVIDIRFC